MTAGAPLAMQGRDWEVTHDATGLFYSDRHGELALPLPALRGAHQAANAGLALAMLRHQDQVTVSEAACATGMHSVRWPGRLHQLPTGPLTARREVWLDGGHNPSAGQALAAHFAGRRLHLIIGMIEGKDPMALCRPLAPRLASVTAVPVPQHECHEAAAFGAGVSAAADVADALARLPEDGLPVLIAGSLYLAGDVLRRNGEEPD